MPFLNLSNFRAFPIASASSYDTKGKGKSLLRAAAMGKATVKSTTPQGGFDFTSFFAAFDCTSEVSVYLENFDPGRFLANLQVAASPINDAALQKASPPTSSKPSLLQSTSNDAASEQGSMLRTQAREQLDRDLGELEAVVTKMEQAGVDGASKLRHDFEAAKVFIFDAVAHSNFQALDIHIEFEDDGINGNELLERACKTPPPVSPRLKTIPLPEVTPVSTPRGWGASTPTGGLGFRIVASPRVAASEAYSYFCNIIPPTPYDPSGQASSAAASGQNPTRPHHPKRSSSWFRPYSGLFLPEGRSTPRHDRSFMI